MDSGSPAPGRAVPDPDSPEASASAIAAPLRGGRSGSDWKGHPNPRALVPAELGQRILTIYLWASGLSVLAAALPVYVQNPAEIRRRPEYWVFFGMAAVQLAAAFARKIPFIVRYGVLAATLTVLIAIGSMTVGITPTWVILVSMLLTATALLYGIAAGLVGVAIVAAIEALIGWAWVQGWLPVVGNPADLAAFYDYREATVWIRVIASTSIFLAGILLLMRYVLSSLHHAVHDSKLAYERVAAEQEHRAKVTEALRASEAKFSRVFRASPVSIIVSRLKTGEIIEANDAFLTTYDCTREQTIGHTTLGLGLWRDETERERLVDAIRRGEHVRDFRIKGRTVTGRAITVLVNCELFQLDDEALLLTLVQDVTEQELAEKALRESEEKFSRAFRAGPHAMAISELETGRYIDVNEVFVRMFGYTREEAIGRTSVELGIFRSAAERENLIRRLRDTGAVHDLELETQNRRGEPITYIVSAELMTLGDQRCIVLSAHDITARKRAEIEHARAVDREMRTREEFTRRLLDAQEAERKRIAGELHDSLGQNLLLLKNRAHLARKNDTTPPNLHWQFESIEEMASQAIAEVRQISHDLHPYQLDQLGLTGALESMVTGASRSTGFPFTAKFDAVDDAFDPEAATHVFRIIQECLNNVLKHARASEARILVERDIHDVRLVVEDNGAGFAVERQGFGLTNIAERVRILGGVLRIESAPGKGARVEVRLPLRSVD